MATSRALHHREVEDALRAIEQGRFPRELESQTLDFKEFKPPAGNDRDPLKRGATDLAEAAACLANGIGGSIVVGIRDNAPGHKAVAGLPEGLDAEDLRHRIYRLTSPNLVVDVAQRSVRHGQILVIGVQAGFDLHRAGGKLRERIDTACEPMTPEREARVRDDRRNYDWSDEQSDRTIEHISPSAIEELRRLLLAAGDGPSMRRSQLSPADLLRECGVLGERGFLNRAGALLFCSDRAESPSMNLQYLRRRTPGGPLSHPATDLGAPVLLALSETLALIEAINETSAVTLPNGVQQQLETIPRAAVREAIVNAVAHRDYRLPEQVSIEHSPTTLVVASPGELVFGVTESNLLTHVSKPRNRALAGALGTVRLAERAGTGVDTMVRAMIRAGHAPPEFHSAEERVRVVLHGGAPVARVAALIAQLPDELSEDTDAVLIVHHLRSHSTVDAVTLAQVIQKSEAEAADALRRLSDDRLDLLEPTRESRRSRGPAYRFRERVRSQLGTLLPYHRNQRDEVDRRIIAHLREYGTISNQTARNLFQVEVVRASLILRDLAERDVIRKTRDSPQRGPTVRYEPGARFPRRRS